MRVKIPSVIAAQTRGILVFEQKTSQTRFSISESTIKESGNSNTHKLPGPASTKPVMVFKPFHSGIGAQW